MATVADVRCTTDFVAALYRTGMRGVRINSAHVSPDTFRRMTAVIRSVSEDIKILMDTKGPEVRTAPLPRPMAITEGCTYRFSSDAEDTDAIGIRVADIGRYVEVGTEMLVDDGELRFEVVSVKGDTLTCRALNSGELDSCKTVAFTGVEVPPLPAVSDRDRENIRVAVEQNIDMIAHSFVRSAADVEAVRELIAGSGITLYAKIECSEALDNLEEITSAADGVLVARGDLGTHIPLPCIPGAQFRAADTAHKAQKPLILATQILQSMMTRPQPTRAELSDIALACFEGFDWLLLTGETARGEYPAECVDILYRTIEEASKIPCKLSTTI